MPVLLVVGIFRCKKITMELVKFLIACVNKRSGIDKSFLQFTKFTNKKVSEKNKMNEETRKITIVLPDKSEIILKNVPEHITADQFLKRIATIDRIQNLKSLVHIKQNGIIVEGDSEIILNVISLETYEKEVKKSIGILYLAMIIVFITLPVLSTTSHFSYLKPFLLYLLSIELLIYSMVVFLVPPPENLLNAFKDNIVIEIFVLLLKSLSPNFRLENLLIHQ